MLKFDTYELNPRVKIIEPFPIQNMQKWNPCDTLLAAIDVAELFFAINSLLCFLISLKPAKTKENLYYSLICCLSILQ